MSRVIASRRNEFSGYGNKPVHEGSCLRERLSDCGGRVRSRAGDQALRTQYRCGRRRRGVPGVDGEREGRIRLVNADGSIAEISGNGTRCVAAWMAHQKSVPVGGTIVLETDAGVRESRLVRLDGQKFEFAAGM